MIHSVLVSLLIGSLRLYKRYISPLLGNHCRFHPSCSEYAEEAIRTHGIFHGLWLTALRIARCNPIFEGGLDPVPAPKKN